MTKEGFIGLLIGGIIVLIFIMAIWSMVDEERRCREKGGVPIHTGNSMYINCASKDYYIDNQ